MPLFSIKRVSVKRTEDRNDHSADTDHVTPASQFQALISGYGKLRRVDINSDISLRCSNNWAYHFLHHSYGRSTLPIQKAC